MTDNVCQRLLDDPHNRRCGMLIVNLNTFIQHQMAFDAAPAPEFASLPFTGRCRPQIVEERWPEFGSNVLGFDDQVIQTLASDGSDNALPR